MEAIEHLTKLICFIKFGVEDYVYLYLNGYVLVCAILGLPTPACLQQLPTEAQTQLKEQLLAAIPHEQSESIRKKMCEVAAEMARNLFDDDGNSLWPEFLNFLFECASSQNAQQRECALLLFR